jgi:hypothetical protein
MSCAGSTGDITELIRKLSEIEMDKAGKISFFNEYAPRFLGYYSEEILGQDVKIRIKRRS